MGSHLELNAVADVGAEAGGGEIAMRLLLDAVTPIARAVEGAVASPGVPVVLADGADATTGGGNGDGNLLLQHLLATSYSDTAALVIVDPAAVSACFAAGVGASVHLKLGVG